MEEVIKAYLEWANRPENKYAVNLNPVSIKLENGRSIEDSRHQAQSVIVRTEDCHLLVTLGSHVSYEVDHKTMTPVEYVMHLLFRKELKK